MLFRSADCRPLAAAKLSYIEIYNEDLIDLLAGDLDVRPTVQIREDKFGSIIWSGLREVKVTSAADVMKYAPRFADARCGANHVLSAISLKDRPSAKQTPPT